MVDVSAFNALFHDRKRGRESQAENIKGREKQRSAECQRDEFIAFAFAVDGRFPFLDKQRFLESE